MYLPKNSPQRRQRRTPRSGRPADSLPAPPDTELAQLLNPHSAGLSASSALFDRQFELLKVELQVLESAIRSHDEIGRSVKSWAIVAWGSSLGFVLNHSLQPLAWATALVPLAFWIVDGGFRSNQRAFILRLREISRYLNSGSFLAAATNSTAMEVGILRIKCASTQRPAWMRVLFYRTVASLYILLITGSLLVGWLLA